MSKRTRRGGDRGIALLELAIVFPFIALLAFGTAEAGLAWTAHNRVQGAVSTGARVGSAAGQDANADRTILVSLRAAMTPEALANADRIIIFKPTNVNGGIPSGCKKAVGSTNQTGVTGACNTYTGATLRAVTTSTDLGTADNSWDGAARHDSLADTGGPDYLGVWVRTKYTAKTGTFFNDLMITATSIYRLQPDIDG